MNDNALWRWRFPCSRSRETLVRRSQTLRPKVSRLRLLIALVLLLPLISSGCHWNPFKKRSVFEPSPVLFLEGRPTLQEIQLATNANNDRVRVLSGPGTLRVPGAPPINASIDFQRPLGFRFRAGT